MKCPNNHESWQELKIGSTKVDRCFECEGLWFDQDELRLAKDSEDNYLKWFDFDLWSREKEFQTQPSSRLCPKDQTPMYKVNYQGSVIEIDTCKQCLGIWLDKDEFKNIIEFLKGRSSYDLLNNYTKALLEEGKEIFTGPENLRSEIGDFLIVLQLLKFKLAFGNPKLTQVLMNLPFTK